MDNKLNIRQKFLDEVKEKYFSWLIESDAHKDAKTQHDISKLAEEFDAILDESLNKRIAFLSNMIFERKSYIAYFCENKLDDSLEAIMLKDEYKDIIDQEAKEISKERLKMLKG